MHLLLNTFRTFAKKKHQFKIINQIEIIIFIQTDCDEDLCNFGNNLLIDFYLFFAILVLLINHQKSKFTQFKRISVVNNFPCSKLKYLI